MREIQINMDGPACLPGSVGQKYSGSNNKIIDADEDGYGKIVSNGRFVFMGYQKDEIKTKEAFTSDGYFKSAFDRQKQKSAGISNYH